LVYTALVTNYKELIGLFMPYPDHNLPN